MLFLLQLLSNTVNCYTAAKFMLLYNCIYKDKKPSLKWALFLNGRSSGSRCLLRIPLEERGRASMPVHFTLHTDTLPKATEEISQLRLKMAAVWQSFCLILWRFNQTCVFVTRFFLRNSCLKKSSYFSAVSQYHFAAPVANIHLHPVSMFSASGIHTK